MVMGQKKTLFFALRYSRPLRENLGSKEESENSELWREENKKNSLLDQAGACGLNLR
jgi:hypothetical protein